MRSPMKDLPVVHCTGSLEQALHELKRKVVAGGALRTLKMRVNNPTRADRRRFTDHKAGTRRRKAELQKLLNLRSKKKRAAGGSIGLQGTAARARWDGCREGMRASGAYGGGQFSVTRTHEPDGHPSSHEIKFLV